jgi:hypothetical protein
MLIEARRHNVRFVRAYVVRGILAAISASFPLLLLARQARPPTKADERVANVTETSSRLLMFASAGATNVRYASTTEKGNLMADRVLYYSASTGRGLIGSVDANNTLQDVTVIPDGSFAQDWTQITALSGDRILYYSASTGRGLIGSVDANNTLQDVTVIPDGSFAQDWTQITALSSDRILYYSASTGRGLIGSIDANNTLQDVTVIPDGSFAQDWTQITSVGVLGGLLSPWAILLCQFSDASSPPSLPRQRFEELYTSQGSGKLNMVDFFRDMSHGALDLSGSKVFGWHTLRQKVSEYVGSGGNPQGRRDLIQWARQAAADAGDNLSPFSNRVLVITNPPTDLFGGPDGAVSGDGRDSAGMSSVSPSLMGQEMGHVYGLDHSWGRGREYGDEWDIMSTRNSSMAPHPIFTDPDAQGRPIFRLGPGLNAANMSGRGWLDSSRVWQASDEESSMVVKLRPLHRRDLQGFLCARVGPYFFEFRVKERWDAGIPGPTVLVHEFDFNRSYLLTATNGQDSLQKGDEFLRGDPSEPTGLTPVVQIKVVDIDAAARVATLEVTRRPDRQLLAGPATTLFGAEGDGGGLILIGGKVVKVPPRSPLYAMVEEIAQLQQTGVTVNAQVRDQLHRGTLRAIASLANDQLSRMDSPREPIDLVHT